MQLFSPSTSAIISIFKFVPRSSIRNSKKQMLYKKKSKFPKEHHRPISILPNIFKVYKRCLYDQISIFFEEVFSKYYCGFSKGYSAQQCLLFKIEKWLKKRWRFFGALLKIYLKPLIAFCLTFSMQNWKHMVSKQMH